METNDINTTITELTSLYDNLNKRWDNDQCLTDIYQVYRQTEYKEAYEKLKNSNIENVVLGILANSLSDNLLVRLRVLLSKNVQIYEARQNDFINIDFHKIYSLHEKHLFDNELALLLKDKEDIQAFTYPTEQEKEMLLKENRRDRNLLENERSEYIRSNLWILENYYTKIYEITQSFISIINSYFTVGKEVIPESETEEQNIQSNQLEVESDMIFRSEMFEKFLLLEQKLINDKYLDENMHWTLVHKNNRTNIKDLIIFLIGLLENRYFLPNKDPKIKLFFESRYNISIGQNFEQKRREPLLSKYKIVFHDYNF